MNPLPPVETIEQIFKNIHSGGGWDGFSSGEGSLWQNTINLRTILPGILDCFKIKSLLDVRCGNFNWMKEVDLSNVSYIGGDVVSSIVENNKPYSRNNLKFMKINIIEDKLPESDLIIVKDCFIHFPILYVKESVKNIKKSNSKYILTTTTNEEKHCNKNIEFGSWTWLNLQKDPYNFPHPIIQIKEEENSKFISLWNINDLPDF